MNKLRHWLAGVVVAGFGGAALAAVPGHQHGDAHGSWTAQPLLEKARGFNRSMTLLRPVGLHVDGATVLPSVETDAAPVVSQVPLREGKLAVRSLSPGQGGYYRIAAMEQADETARIASTIVYFSNPGPAPRAMLAQSAMPLEIVPATLPREHRHYRAGETWSFELRGNGRPLADHPVLFETEQGTRGSLFSDGQGRVQVTFPDDFPEVVEAGDHAGHHRGAGSAFVLSAVWRSPEGVELLTAFNQDYQPAAYAGKSPWLGGGFALLGMLAATPLLRKRREAAS